MNKRLQWAQHILRKAHLLTAIEQARYVRSVLKYRQRNAEFVQQHPEFALPPKSLAYDAYSAPDWNYYYHSGKKLAEILMSLMKSNGFDANSGTVLEWGCGPGRIIRHVPGQLNSNGRVFGSDYNRASIQWATNAIPDVKFVTNDLHPPLPFSDKSFDAVYCFSVFTHLAQKTSFEWIAEIRRVLKDGGLFFFTTHSDSYIDFLLPHEEHAYREEGCYVRGDYREGKKMFLAFQSPDYIKREWLPGFDLLQHYLPGSLEYITAQDGWFVRKK